MDVLLVPTLIAAILTAVLVVARSIFRTLTAGAGSGCFNSTSDWTPVPDHDPQAPPAGTMLAPYDRKLVTPYLETDERLEGFARCFFSPARRQDWGFGSGIAKLPLLVAVTSRRLLLFEVRVLKVLRYRFARLESVRMLRPPKAGFLGTSGHTRFALPSGEEYQIGFLGPLLSDQGMREEQRLAAVLRGLGSPDVSQRAA